MWGRSEGNRKSGTPQGTGQLPACELTGWPNVDAQGFGVTQTCDVPARVVKPSFSPCGEGGPSGENPYPWRML
jgi:hypothetical protein